MGQGFLFSIVKFEGMCPSLSVSYILHTPLRLHLDKKSGLTVRMSEPAAPWTDHQVHPRHHRGEMGWSKDTPRVHRKWIWDPGSCSQSLGLAM